MKLDKIICPNCNNKFQPKRIDQIYCCKNCGKAYRKETPLYKEKATKQKEFIKEMLGLEKNNFSIKIKQPKEREVIRI